MTSGSRCLKDNGDQRSQSLEPLGDVHRTLVMWMVDSLCHPSNWYTLGLMLKYTSSVS